ncbi:hypothetical protein FQN54_003671 [Arachnomyces sp. PD_36]|nr:hypothetical protein FQN54_003671 [Arachnomyces sp. PD_36]
MVSTRHHPKEFPPPAIPSPNGSKSDSGARQSTPSSTPSRTKRGSSFAHIPSKIVVLWLLVSIPLVVWDTGYIMLRPHSMPGGWLHSPLWTPYALYGTIDYVYGWPAFNARNGFTAAQGFMNIIETLCLVFYLVVVFRHGETVNETGKKKAEEKGILGSLIQDRAVEGRLGAVALLVLFSAMTMTLSKTLLYWSNEFFSGFGNIGHNDLSKLIPLWIIPNGLWIIFPAYSLAILGPEIINALESSTAGRGKGSKSK